MPPRPRTPRWMALCLGVALALAFAAPAAAEISFVAPVSFPVPDAQRLAVGDFNKDGPLDIATANTQQTSASVLFGDGQAGLGPAASYTVPGHPADVETADFNGDTFPDLAVTGQDSGKVTVLFGAAGGSFGPAVDIAGAPNANRLAVGDVNGDAKTDLVVGEGAGSSKVDVLLGDGAGGFGGPTSYSVFATPQDVALADMNGDNHPDIVAASGIGVWVLLGVGDGTFTIQNPAVVGSQVTDLATADFNADQKLDVAVGVSGQGVSVMLGDGQGGLGSAASYPTPSAGPVGLAAADLDRDGIIDIVATGGNVASLRGAGGGRFDAAVSHNASGVSLVVVDLDGDNMPDLVLAANQNVTVLGNNSTPTLPVPVVARTANAEPVKGTVLVKQPGKNRFVRLEQGTQIRIGSEVDVTKGTVTLTTAAGGGQTQSGVFRGGLFKLGQKKGPRPITELKLAAKLRCVSGRKPAHVGAKARRSRQLFGNAHGRFRTRGRHSTATIRGTKWLVKDTCNTTLTVAQKGTVVVRDLVKRRTVTLKSGQRYVARRGNR